MQLFTTLLTALALVSSTMASPAPVAIKRGDDMVVSPHITKPSEVTSWRVGTQQTVTWDTSGIPKGYTGTIKLGFDNGSGSENLDWELARDFPLTSGSKTVIVPNVPSKSKYYVVLLGDATNKSPEFSIHH